MAEANHSSASGTLSPLTPELSHGLIPVTLFGVLSFGSATILLALISFRLLRWNQKSKHVNQFVVLICNLLLADIQQSMAFLLNAKWLAENRIHVGTSTCWAQGWFVSTGDLASGVWSFAIGLHTFAVVIFGYRLSTMRFMIAILLLWTFVYAMAVVGIAMHSSDFYVRAVAWCWVNVKYGRLRLWLHYFWIFAFECGTVLIYGVLIVALRWRIRSNYYRSQQQEQQAKDAAKLMVAYPIIYVLCTLPLATLRMYQESADERVVSASWFCLAGAMITSNGWLDVILYCVTRRIMLFSDEPPNSDNGIESFGTPWVKRDVYGTETKCEHVPTSPIAFRRRLGRHDRDDDTIYMVDRPVEQHVIKDKAGQVTITAERTIEVRSDPAADTEQQFAADGYLASKNRHELWSVDSDIHSKTEGGPTRPATPGSIDYEIENLEFKTKPNGF
ncbi:uncharacterized protein PV09_01676 [Verruconis gallopava]|uniref:G-protein coupled receptors family 1 profile domain-containing protein n=1 Tax=Verruconis gallopava TaxID=253628 RepID=A0A0D1XY51_9PEZI|nr:uncharacterized protein PV09_01676 [Verruconis gallopava]KIW07746.1 hypothetical protein PV09_01676 [Verruconis gallopava]